MSTREAFGKALARIGSDANIVVLDADVSGSTKTSEFRKLYPQRFVNFGIAEENLFATAIGLAYSGLKVYASLYSVFVLKAYDQLRIIAHDNLDVKIFASHSGLTNASDGWSHQTVEDVAVLRAMPNFRVIVPADAVETESVTEVSLSLKGPFYVRLSRSESPLIFEKGFRFELGKGNIMNEGSDAYIIANGNMLSLAIKAVEMLKKEGISAGLINMSSVKPIDEDLIIKAARQSGAIVTAEEHSIIGGLGGAVAEVLARSYPVPVEQVGINDSFGQSGSLEELFRFYGLTAEKIVDAAKRVIVRKR
ncbi:MAG: transketolase family protein [Nitrososphaeria archaeon]